MTAVLAIVQAVVTVVTGSMRRIVPCLRQRGRHGTREPTIVSIGRLELTPTDLHCSKTSGSGSSPTWTADLEESQSLVARLPAAERSSLEALPSMSIR